jgi:hypothetical protein
VEKLKEHLDKIVGSALIILALALIAKTFLGGDHQGIDNDLLETKKNQVKNARHGLDDGSKSVPGYGARLAAQMSRAEAPVGGKLSAWAFYAIPEFREGKKPVREWTVCVQRFPPNFGGGYRVCVGEFETPNEDAAKKTKADLVAKGYAKSEVVHKTNIDAPPESGYVATPTVNVKGIYVGKTNLAALFSDRDRNCTVRVIQVWRRKAAQDKWPEEPQFVLKVKADGKAELLSGNGARGSGSGLDISETELQAREEYEYRARTAGSFAKGIQVEEGLKRDKALDAVLGGEAYVSGYSAPVKVATPGQVQIQFAGKMEFDGRVYGNFNFKLYTASGAVMRKTDKILLGKRIKHSFKTRIEGKPKLVLIDAEANVVKISYEMRPTTVKVPEFKKDPETGVLVQVMVTKPGPPRRVEVAEIEDVRTGKRHKLDKPGFGEQDLGWWPKGVAGQAAPAPTPGVTPKDPGTTVRREPVVRPTPRPTPTPVVRPRPEPRPRPRPEPRPEPDRSEDNPYVSEDGSPRDPGAAPDYKIGDPASEKRYEQWKAAKRAWDEEKANRESSTQN